MKISYYGPDDNSAELDDFVNLDSLPAALGVIDSSKFPSDDLESNGCDSILSTDRSNEFASLQMHNSYGLSLNMEDVSQRMLNKETQTPVWKSYESFRCQTDPLCTPAVCFSTQTIQSSFCTILDQGTQVDIPSWTFEDIKGNDKKVLFYTGIPNTNILEGLFEELKVNA